MKKVTMTVFCLLTTAAFANMGNNGPMMQKMFDQFKQMRIDHIQKKISIEQSTLSCVQAAQKKEDMKTCEDNERQQMEKLHESQKKKFESMRQSQPAQ